jgi:LmbE family N-acetylglucosaminyl deacetylase
MTSAGPDGIDWPEGVTNRGQTAFIALNVTVTPSGRFIDPFIEVSHGTTRYRQYFERGAAGQRYLNLSPLFQDGRTNAGGRIRLWGRSIRWKREASLRLFEHPPVANAMTLVVAPHSDDAEIAAFGMYASHPSWVATLTAGVGMADLSAALPRDTDRTPWIANLRVWDSLTIPQLGGVPRERCLNLVYPDGELRNMHREPGRPVRIACERTLSRATLRARNEAVDFRGGNAECTWEGLVAELRRLLMMVKPEIILCPHPIVDGHHDHVFSTVALNEAIRGTPHNNPLFFLYVVHRRDVPIYPFGPAAGLVSVPPWTDNRWVADSLYSHPLRREHRTAKYFAVEAMHDLRTYGTGDPRTVRQAFTLGKREMGALLGGTGSPAASFLRRAPRPNEVYCVVSVESLAELVERALASHSAEAR